MSRLLNSATPTTTTTPVLPSDTLSTPPLSLSPALPPENLSDNFTNLLDSLAPVTSVQPPYGIIGNLTPPIGQVVSWTDYSGPLIITDFWHRPILKLVNENGIIKILPLC